MSAKPAKPRAAVKSASCRIRNQKCRIRNLSDEVSGALMQAMKDLLKPRNVAHELNYFTDVPVPSVQKMMSGDRPVNLELVIGLLRSEHGRETLFALMGDANPAWFAKYRKQLDVNETRRKLIDAQRQIEALQTEVL